MLRMSPENPNPFIRGQEVKDQGDESLTITLPAWMFALLRVLAFSSLLL